MTIYPNDYWFTPAEVWKAVHTFMPDYFDPCPVKPNCDGLKIDWQKDCYINPPYSTKLKHAFITKALWEHKPGDRFLWMFNYANSRDLWAVHKKASAVLIPEKRFRFIPGHPDLSRTNHPRYDNIMILWGDNTGFAECFGHLGKVYRE